MVVDFMSVLALKAMCPIRRRAVDTSSGKMMEIEDFNQVHQIEREKNEVFMYLSSFLYNYNLLHNWTVLI